MVRHEQTYGTVKKGIVYSLLAWFCISLSYLIAKKIHLDTTVSLMVFFRCLIGSLFFFFAVRSSKERGWKAARPLLMTLRSLSSLGSVAFIYLSLQSLSIIDASLLQNCAPFFVPLIGFIWLRRPIDHRLWLPIIIGFAGVVLILRPDANFFHSGAFYALLAAVTTALSMISVRLLTGSENKMTALFYTFAGGLVLVAPFAVFNWHVSSPEIYVPLLALGLLAMIGQWLLFVSLEHASASHMTPFSFSAVLYAGLFDWLFFNQVPGVVSWIGLAAITIGGLWILRLNK